MSCLGIYFTEKHASGDFQWFFQLWGWMLQKLFIISKTASNESSTELDFLQKPHRKQIFISPRSVARVAANICHVIKLKSFFFGGWRLPKLSIILKNVSNKNCIKLNFQQNTQWAHVFISPRSGAMGYQRFAIFEIMHWSKKIGSFRAECCQKYRSYRKLLQSKVVQN